LFVYAPARKTIEPMLITTNIHALLADTAATETVSCWSFVPSDERRPDYGLALAWRCVR
jgi:hypothetical protein